MKAEGKHFSVSKVLWGHILLGVFFCTVFVACISFLSQTEAANENGTESASYRVVFVNDDDTLKVRSAPGSSNTVVGTLAPSALGVHITGEKKMVGKTAWYPITASGLKGWVVGRYLTQDVAPEEFCDVEFDTFLSTLRKTVSEKKGDLLASLVDEDRGLRLYLDAWSKGAPLSAKQLGTIFTDPTKSTWGLDPDEMVVEKGTFSEIVLPSLYRIIMNATTMSCNKMNHPEASEPRTLPKGATGINFYSYYRSPGPDEDILNWGEWVVGIEKWRDRWVLSYLALYKWTP